MKINGKTLFVGAGASLLWAAATVANAASVTYLLDQSNIAPLPDGNSYLTVTIDDEGGIGAAGDSIITFTVQTVSGAFTPIPGAFGIQSFGFADIGGFITGDSPSSQWILPTGWSGNLPPPQNNEDGFGRFDLSVSTAGAADRQDPLVFSLDVLGDSIANYVELSTNSTGEGNVFFAAHVAGFETSDPLVTSGFFGGSTPVPLPAAAWLFGSGLVGVFGIGRRRLQSKA